MIDMIGCNIILITLITLVVNKEAKYTLNNSNINNPYVSYGYCSRDIHSYDNRDNPGMTDAKRA